MTPIILPVAELKSGLAGLGKVISSKGTLPVLQSLRIERTPDGWVCLTATDLDRFVTLRLEQPAKGEPFAMLVPYAELLRKADAIFIDELRRHDLYDKTSQAFAVFLPVRSVAVMGDGRRYDYVIALRAVETIDFMTARWSRLPYEFLDLVGRRIINEVHGISRVTYDISGKPPATIEWE